MMGEEGLMKLIESFSEEVVEAIDRRVCAGRSSTHDERLEEEKGSVVEGKLMEIDRFI